MRMMDTAIGSGRRDSGSSSCHRLPRVWWATMADRGALRGAAWGAVCSAVCVAEGQAPPSTVAPEATTALVAPAQLDEALPPVRALIQGYAADRALLQRRFGVPGSEVADTTRIQFERGTLKALEAVDFTSLSRDQQIDAILLRNHAERAIARFEAQQARHAEIAELVPFAAAIAGLEEARREFQPQDARLAAEAVEEIGRQVRRAKEEAQRNLDRDARPPRHLALRAARLVDSLRWTLRGWHDFRAGYDPLFSWWVAAPWRKLDGTLAEYSTFLRERVADAAGAEAIVGDPIGREALRRELAAEFIPFDPMELMAMAEAEYAWCLDRMIAASRELGCGDDWKAALAKVKQMHVDPGDQPRLVRDLAIEAVEFLESRELLTIPELAKTGWRMEMLSAERQRTSPYFLGGETVMVSFPTSEMDHDQKLMSLRSNNEHFSRAVVHHELIPGHHLQGFMTSRHRAHRTLFETPFWIEGWAVWWEMHLWDLGFPRNAADRIGMLFWRMHRCARVRFSLGFHLGEMTPQECIDLLVERVGHEPSAAEAEVRRSLSGDYGPLYQAAYLLGAMQFRALHHELVRSGLMTEREFHDAILRLGPIPVELVRASLVEEPLELGHTTRWRFGEGRRR